MFTSVFPSFTHQIRHVWISFNTQSDQWIKAHPFLFLYVFPFSISIVYPSNKTRMNFIQYAKWSVNQGASFSYFNILLFICTIYTILSFSISIVYPSNKTRVNFIQYAKWSVNQGAYFCYFNIVVYLYKYIYKLYNFTL